MTLEWSGSEKEGRVVRSPPTQETPSGKGVGNFRLRIERSTRLISGLKQMRGRGEFLPSPRRKSKLSYFDSLVGQGVGCPKPGVSPQTSHLCCVVTCRVVGRWSRKGPTSVPCPSGPL